MKKRLLLQSIMIKTVKDMTSEINSQLISVSIVDDHTLVATMLGKTIDDSGIARVIDIYANLKSCRAGLAKSLPKILLLDIELPDGDGVDFCAEIRKTYPELKIIMLTSYEEYNVIKRALYNGALGYVLKNVKPEEIFAGIETVNEGQLFLCDKVEMLLKKKSEKQVVKFSLRDKEVLQGIADGCTTKAIAKKINRGEETVKSIRKNLLIKLDAINAFEMVKKACEQNLIRKT